MSKAGRWGLAALAVVVLVAGFLIARPDDDDGESVSNTPAADTGERQPTATAPSAPEPPPDGPDQPRAVRIELTGHVPAGGVKTVVVAKGQPIRFTVTSDEADDVHVHGYDVEQPVGPGAPATFGFRADVEGIFEVESHEAEHAGKDPLIARLVVEPS